jgi:hypothetical protein
VAVFFPTETTIGSVGFITLHAVADLHSSYSACILHNDQKLRHGAAWSLDGNSD